MPTTNYRELILIIRPAQALQTEAILLSHGAEYVSRHSVTGRGKEMALRKISSWLGAKTQALGYVRKVFLSALVSEEKIAPLLKKIVKKNKTGKYGDGKVFVLPLSQWVDVP